MEFKDAELYSMKFRQCMVRALTLIKMHFVDTLQFGLKEIQAKLQNEKVFFKFLIHFAFFFKHKK